MSIVKTNEDIINNRVNYLLEYKKKLVEFYTLKVDPIVITPKCIEEGLKEDCFKCNITDSCDSPRGWCIKPYRGHPKGCINHGNKEGCPPNVPMFYDVFDKSKSIYLGINDYDMVKHIKNAINDHPEWNIYQASNIRHYQPYMEAINKSALKEWIKDYPDLVVTNWIESMGVDLVKTLKNHNIDLKFGEYMKTTRRIILMGSLLPNVLKKNNLKIENSNNIKTLRMNK